MRHVGTYWRARARRVTIICQQRARIVSLGGNRRFLTIADKEPMEIYQIRQDTIEVFIVNYHSKAIPLHLDENKTRVTDATANFSLRLFEQRKEREKENSTVALQFSNRCRSI